MLEPSRRLCRIGCALCVALLITGCSGEKPEVLYAKAQKHVAAGESKAAVIELKNVLQQTPDHRDARLLLGRLYVEAGDGAGAEKELRRALQLGASHDEVLPLLGRALLLQREYRKVLEEIPAQPAGPQAALLYALRGEAHAGLKALDEARKAFEQARALAPGLPEANRGLAAMLLAEGRQDEALQLADESVAKTGKEADPWMLKGDLLRAQGKAKEAAAAYGEALKRNPRHLGAHLSLALIHMGDKDFASAQRHIDAARGLEPKAPAVRLTQAQSWFLQGKYGEARDELQEVLKVAPNNGSAILLMGVTQLALNNLSQAESYLSAFVEAIPDHAYARRMLAATHLRKRQPDKALEVLKPLLAAAQPDPLVLALAGEAHMQRREYARAGEYLEKAAQARPEHPGVRTALALSRLARGQTEAGVAELEAAARLEQSPLQTDLLLIATHLRQKHFDAALAAAEALARKEPRLPLAPHLRGVALMGKKDVAAARQAFEQALALDPAFHPAAASLARLDLAAGNPQAARRRFESVLAANPRSVDAMLGLAALEQVARNEKGAVEWLEKAAKADAKAIAPRALLADHYLARREPQRALTFAREAQAANPDSAQALALLGRVQLAAGEKDNALTTFSRLVEREPDSASAFFQLASAQMAADRLGEARKSLERALTLDPKFTDAQLALIGLEWRGGRQEEALRRAQTLQAQAPKAAGGFVIEGDIHLARNDPARAAALYQKAFEREANPVIAMKLHGSLLAANRPAEARAVAERWLKAHPDDVGMRLYLGESHLKRGEDKEAIAQYRAILEKAPDHLVALNNLAWLLGKQGDAGALAMAERAHRLRPEDPRILDTLGWIHLQAGRARQARDFLAKAVAAAPGEPSVRYHYAVALWKSGDSGGARQELQRALAVGVRFPEEKDAQALLSQLTARP